MLPNKELVYASLKQISEDRSFEKSPRNVRLLKFLVLKAVEEADVNEYIIGLELFEHKYNPDKNDSKVRVYMYNLRKKLEEYYASTGKNDSLIFKLKKGQYNLQFEPRDETERTKGAESQNINVKLKISTGIIVGLIGSAVILISVFVKNKNLYCWNDFFLKDTKNICVLADHTMIWLNYKSRYIPTIHPDINSEADFIRYLDKNKDDSLKLADYTLFSKMAPFSVKELTEWFIQNNSNFSLRLESRFEADEIRDNNILYIGQFKTMNMSKAIFLRNSSEFKVMPKRFGFLHIQEGKQTEYKTKHTATEHIEYAMVSFMQLENGKKALFFVSNNDIGVMATVNNFTNKEWLKDFYEKLPSEQSYFNALFEVSGMRRTEISCNLIKCEVVEE